jgi:hypothetical protein
MHSIQGKETLFRNIHNTGSWNYSALDSRLVIIYLQFGSYVLIFLPCWFNPVLGSIPRLPVKCILLLISIFCPFSQKLPFIIPFNLLFKNGVMKLCQLHIHIYERMLVLQLFVYQLKITNNNITILFKIITHAWNSLVNNSL